MRPSRDYNNITMTVFFPGELLVDTKDTKSINIGTVESQNLFQGFSGHYKSPSFNCSVVIFLS